MKFSPLFIRRLNSPSWARTNNPTVNSRVLYHWAIEDHVLRKCTLTPSKLHTDYTTSYALLQAFILPFLKNLFWSSPRPISSSPLHTLLHFHFCPIYLVVFKGSYCLTAGISHLEGGFTLRCLQRLSLPDLATRLCHWYDNRSTSGPSSPVLSYWGQLLSDILRPRRIGTELSHDVLNPARVPL